MEEIWKDVVGYEGRYEVSSFGNVRGLVHSRGSIGGTSKSAKPKILKPSKNRKGYLCVKLYRDNDCKFPQVHRLVATAFIPNPMNLPCVNHINEDKTDNSVENLEWCSWGYNVNYGTRNKRVANALFNRVDHSKQILQYSKTGGLIRVWPSIHEAHRQTGCPISSISRCCTGKLNTTHGFVWRFADDVPCDTVQGALF